MRRPTAPHLRLVSDAHVARRFHGLPDRATAVALLSEANARAPAGAPVVPGRRPLWLYGAGSLGKLAYAHLAAVGQPVAGVIDRNAAACAADPAWAGVPVLAPEAVPEAVRAQALCAVAIVTLPYAPLEAALNQAGWAHCVPVYDVTEAFRDQHPLGNGWFAAPLGADALEAAGRVLAGFADAQSRAHYLRFAAWRLARQEWEFSGAPVEPATRFFIPEVSRALGHAERFLDAGAHHGTVVARLLEITRGAISTVWAVEPDAESRAVLNAYVGGLDLDLRARIQVLDAVLGARAEAVRFHEGLGYASQIAPTGRTLRASVPLDALTLDPSFVKLHLEGGERDALAGARQTLLRHRPIIAATVYHDAAGLIETPAWLMSELPDYSVLMRTHGWCGTGAVLYAIPTERVAR
ncbi:FkbM family methyltransferase [Xanthobacter sp. V4C-4]|uniref:FkbM family methyltransferase n=1 Tax=Xanthobacter cornucopiae TaxID=3119924 RepID=UPI003727EC3B